MELEKELLEEINDWLNPIDGAAVFAACYNVFRADYLHDLTKLADIYIKVYKLSPVPLDPVIYPHDTIIGSLIVAGVFVSDYILRALTGRGLLERSYSGLHSALGSLKNLSNTIR